MRVRAGQRWWRWATASRSRPHAAEIRAQRTIRRCAGWVRAGRRGCRHRAAEVRMQICPARACHGGRRLPERRDVARRGRRRTAARRDAAWPCCVRAPPDAALRYVALRYGALVQRCAAQPCAVQPCVARPCAARPYGAARPCEARPAPHAASPPPVALQWRDHRAVHRHGRVRRPQRQLKGKGGKPQPTLRSADATTSPKLRNDTPGLKCARGPSRSGLDCEKSPRRSAPDPAASSRSRNRH